MIGKNHEAKIFFLGITLILFIVRVTGLVLFPWITVLLPAVVYAGLYLVGFCVFFTLTLLEKRYDDKEK